MREPEHTANIIQLRSTLIPEFPSREQSSCHHSNIVVVEDQRLLLCKDCQLWIDPFEYLLRWAARDWAAAKRVIEYRQDLEKLITRIRQLKKEERNIKARLRRLNKP